MKVFISDDLAKTITIVMTNTIMNNQVSCWDIYLLHGVKPMVIHCLYCIYSRRKDTSIRL